MYGYQQNNTTQRTCTRCGVIGHNRNNARLCSMFQTSPNYYHPRIRRRPLTNTNTSINNIISTVVHDNDDDTFTDNDSLDEENHGFNVISRQNTLINDDDDMPIININMQVINSPVSIQQDDDNFYDNTLRFRSISQDIEEEQLLDLDNILDSSMNFIGTNNNRGSNIIQEGTDLDNQILHLINEQPNLSIDGFNNFQTLYTNINNVIALTESNTTNVEDTNILHAVNELRIMSNTIYSSLRIYEHFYNIQENHRLGNNNWVRMERERRVVQNIILLLNIIINEQPEDGELIEPETNNIYDELYIVNKYNQTNLSEKEKLIEIKKEIMASKVFYKVSNHRRNKNFRIKQLLRLSTINDNILINNINTTQYNYNTECSICYENKEQSFMCHTKCNHNYCVQCMGTFIRSRPGREYTPCPMCRTNIDEINTYDVMGSEVIVLLGNNISEI